jgi:hypothetical protein
MNDHREPFEGSKKILWDAKKKPRIDRGEGFKRTSKRESRTIMPDSKPRLDAEFGLEELVDGLRIGLSASLFHHLTNKPTEH